MTDEPRRHRFFLLLLGLTVLCTSPFPFIGSGSSTFLGIPLWLWWSIFFTIGLSCLTAVGILRYWKDDRLE